MNLSTFLRKVIIPITISLLVSIPSFSQSYLGIEDELKKHVEFLADPALKGRRVGSEGEKAAADYIYEQLRSSGLMMLTNETGQSFAVLQENGDSLWSQNIVAIVEGYDKVLKNEYVVIGAHYDHLGTNILVRDGKEELQIFRGADDNASGTACFIELAKQVARQSFLFKRSVIFVAFGAEEIGMAGSWYFLNRDFRHNDKISYMINIDMVGKSGKGNQFGQYTILKRPDVAAVTDKLLGYNTDVRPTLYYDNIFPSDHLVFHEKGIPVSLFSSGVHRDYHSVRDIPEKLNYEDMASLCEYLFFFTEEIANREINIGVDNVVVEAPKAADNVYSAAEIDKAPVFMHGDESYFLNKWVYTYLKYPVVPLRSGIQGTVMVSFIIEADGNISNVKVTRSVDDDLDAEAVRVVSASPKWKPGELQGRKVRVQYNLPIEFRLKSR